MYHRPIRLMRLAGTSVHTDPESIAIMLATGLSGRSVVHGVVIVLCFAVGTGLHLLGHWGVALAFGKNIRDMVLTRAGHIDYSGAEPALAESLLRISAGPTVNALCAGLGYLAMTWLGVSEVEASAHGLSWPVVLSTFVACSAILTAVNFFPAVPLDGGLLLRTLLSQKLAPAQAERTALWTSLALMTGAFGYALWAREPVLAYVCVAISYDNWRILRGKRSGPVVES